MYAIASNGSLTIQDIGDRISMTSGNMTYTIDKLRKKVGLSALDVQKTGDVFISILQLKAEVSGLK